jgi:Protein of unknown function (DUF1587)/Protein of unknown function (DUF1585)
MKTCFLLGSLALLAAEIGLGQVAPPTGAVAERALLDQYCVTCNNDKLKTANFSLQKLDLTTVGDHPEVWERVVRKLRAGLMPPPGVRRPPLAEYEGLRDWLENEIDRKAAGRSNPGSVVLHRLNRTEYANVIRDLLDLEIDPTTLLPPDDSARGFDNIAGSLTLSPTWLEAYMTAATRVGRMAVGYWKTPTEAAYIAPADTSQNEHIEGLPFGTRGDGGVPIDASSVLWDGTKVDGPIELRQALLHYSPQFVRMITEKPMTYGLGRSVEYEDMPVIRAIVHDADKNHDRFSSILMGVIKSAPFQMRTKVAESTN